MSESPRSWVKSVERIGIASVGFLILAGAMLGGLRWAGNEILLPMVREQIETSKEVRAQLPTQTKLTQKLVTLHEQGTQQKGEVLKVQKQQGEILDRMSQTLNVGQEMHRNQTDMLQDIHRKLECKAKP